MFYNHIDKYGKDNFSSNLNVYIKFSSLQVKYYLLNMEDYPRQIIIILIVRIRFTKPFLKSERFD